jgi:hypothetical protein
MNQFERILNNEPVKNHDNQVIQLPVSSRNFDPRPDLTRDTILWQQLLAGAQDVDAHSGDPEQKLYSALLYMRARGTSLQRTPSGRLALRPYIDPAGNDAWTSQDEYDQEKVKVLKPVEGRLVELLGKMVA